MQFNQVPVGQVYNLPGRRGRLQTCPTLLLAPLALLAAGCTFPGQPKEADRPIPPDRVLAFDALYRQNCSGCHGTDGKVGSPGTELEFAL